MKLHLDLKALSLLAGVFAVSGALLAFPGTSAAGEFTRADRQAARRAAVTPWHGTHYNTQYGRPVAVVVPPTAHMETSYNWGVAQTRSTPIHPQFARPYPGPAAPAGLPFQPTPRFPRSTDQHGYYYVRGPW